MIRDPAETRAAGPARPWAVVPVKSFSAAKSRLAHLGPQDRAQLARGLFEHVMTAIESSSAVAGILVATNGDEVAELARARGSRVIRDDSTYRQGPVGLGAIIDAALARLSAIEAGAALVLMADLPTLSAGDVGDLARAMARYPVVIAPDRHDLGTNALGLRLPAAAPTGFGHPDSFQRHLAMARKGALATHIQRSPGLGFDLDVPDDYRFFAGYIKKSPIAG